MFSVLIIISPNIQIFIQFIILHGAWSATTESRWCSFSKKFLLAQTSTAWSPDLTTRAFQGSAGSFHLFLMLPPQTQQRTHTHRISVCLHSALSLINLLAGGGGDQGHQSGRITADSPSNPTMGVWSRSVSPPNERPWHACIHTWFDPSGPAGKESLTCLSLQPPTHPLASSIALQNSTHSSYSLALTDSTSHLHNSEERDVPKVSSTV